MPYKSKEEKAKWRRRNREKIRAYTVEWNKANPDRVEVHAAKAKAKAKEKRDAVRALRPKKPPKAPDRKPVHCLICGARCGRFRRCPKHAAWTHEKVIRRLERILHKRPDRRDRGPTRGGPFHVRL